MNKSQKRFYPVIHCLPLKQEGYAHALANAKIAYQNGADGIFLIGHKMSYIELMAIYQYLRGEFPDGWIGINFLDLSASTEWPKLERRISVLNANATEKRINGLSGLWMDGLPGVEPSIEIKQKTDLFGGVAFSHTNPDHGATELGQACARAGKLVHIVTISGNDSGEPPAVEKLQVVCRLVGPNKRLAVISGVEAANVQGMLPYADAFLADESISQRLAGPGGDAYLVPEKVLGLAKLIHA